MVVLSHYQVAAWLAARGQAETLRTSLDLGRSEAEVRLETEGVRLPDGRILPWSAVQRVAEDPGGCYRLDGDEVVRIQTFSARSGRAYSLYPTPAAPTLLISGIPMHRIKGTDPWQDTLSKIRVANPRGWVLDTCMGLGYTAIAAARTAEWVLTIELDPAVVAIARQNPWSQPLFEHPHIQILIGDSGEILPALASGVFSCVIHDPPTFALAGELYREEFYAEVYRVLRPRGRMFHYIGDPASKSGAAVTARVRQRLRQAGFQRLTPAPHAFGLLAGK
ncbi:methyltransferase domain-containing protein [Thermanaerothrix sp. 4228-RoL]|uniref:Methyltransferase domain-containing protein n=1 Tax=Thermanaerothrix solaris TaxID=3058434 RepID=A0ABU3NRA9_9CHLR|nr:methyltransferase domain-containing protein [Thermanaerothrix sp. 4228-RoL]MDT8898592.1 methyltransferase domain-containing protein [Thermanaerothrix sp. 4228-RoL]